MEGLNGRALLLFSIGIADKVGDGLVAVEKRVDDISIRRPDSAWLLGLPFRDDNTKPPSLPLSLPTRLCRTLGATIGSSRAAGALLFSRGIIVEFLCCSRVGVDFMRFGGCGGDGARRGFDNALSLSIGVEGPEIIEMGDI